MKERQKHKADILLLGALVLLGLGMALFLRLAGRTGAAVEVRVAGETAARYPLSASVCVEIAGVGGTNLLRIENGEAWIEEANCPDGLCRRMGRIRQAGQSIVCLPHRLVVEIVGAGEDSPDAIAG